MDQFTEELERKMDGRRMQDLYIHTMVSMEYIIWIRDKNKKGGKKGNMNWYLIHRKESKELDMHRTQPE